VVRDPEDDNEFVNCAEVVPENVNNAVRVAEDDRVI
jgi:hypothetical protein